MNTSDFHFVNHGSLFLVTPQNEAAAQHLAENVSDEASWLGIALAVEPRYVEGLAEGLWDAGFTLSGL